MHGVAPGPACPGLAQLHCLSNPFGVWAIVGGSAVRHNETADALNKHSGAQDEALHFGQIFPVTIIVAILLRI
jgi:hypothetical protein